MLKHSAPSIAGWGNPIKVKDVPSVQDAISGYEKYIRGNPQLLKALPELSGKVLGCWCKKATKTTKAEDALCHGDVLIKLLREQGL